MLQNEMRIKRLTRSNPQTVQHIYSYFLHDKAKHTEKQITKTSTTFFFMEN